MKTLQMDILTMDEAIEMADSLYESDRFHNCVLKYLTGELTSEAFIELMTLETIWIEEEKRRSLKENPEYSEG